LVGFVNIFVVRMSIEKVSGMKKDVEFLVRVACLLGRKQKVLKKLEELWKEQEESVKKNEEREGLEEEKETQGEVICLCSHRLPSPECPERSQNPWCKG
jgi:hypothetical protein